MKIASRQPSVLGNTASRQAPKGMKDEEAENAEKAL